MFGPNNKTQVSGNKCTEQDLFFYCVLIEVSIEGLKKKIKNKKRLIIWMEILKVVRIEFSVLNPGLSLRFQVARYMQIIGKDLNSKEILLVHSAFVLFPMKVARGHTGSRT